MPTTTSRSSEESKTTDPTAPSGGVHPSPEEAAAIIERETQQYREHKQRETEGADTSRGAPSAGEIAEPVEGLLTSGTPSARLASELVEDEQRAIKEGQAARKAAFSAASARTSDTRTSEERDRDERQAKEQQEAEAKAKAKS